MGLTAAGLGTAPSLGASDDMHIGDGELVERLIGKVPVESHLVHLDMPSVFGNGYSVPLSLVVDSEMTETDHVRVVHVLAPKNPIILVAKFHFTQHSGRAAVSTRIRLSEPQTVLAVAEMNDGRLLMARTWVKVDTDGCS
jgi:sulfur-oxidizing protein SoxY